MIRPLHFLFTLFAGTVFLPPACPQTDSIPVSGNPIITHIRSADPAAEVWPDGQVWIYASHDPEGATDYSGMEDYHAFSSYDLIHWTDQGVILHASDVGWGNPANAWMFAPDAAYRDGTYYLYFPTLSNQWEWRVGVATSDRPQGPFADVGHYIEGTDNIDPTCFMEEDGSAYLVWGGGSTPPKIARLAENMTELAEAPRILSYGADNFGEGPYLHKRDGIYYFSYTCNTCYPYQAYYSTSDNPYGPYEYKGSLKKAPPGAQDHHSMIEYHGQWYYFYHTGNYGPGGSLYQRNICVDSMFYNPDGSIREVIGTVEGVRQDRIGGRTGIIVPGSIGPEDVYDQEGTVLLPGTDSTGMMARMTNGGRMEFVVEVLGSGYYTLTLFTEFSFPDTETEFSMDRVAAGSMVPEGTSEPVLDSLYLHEGKHIFEIRCTHPDRDTVLLQWDRIRLTGETEFYRIEAISGEGGKIDPEGVSYYAGGEDAVYRIGTYPGYVISDLFVDSIPVPVTDQLVIPGISEDHRIEVWFTACEGIPYEAYYQVNGGEVVNDTWINLTEASSLKLMVVTGNEAGIRWMGPGDFSSTEPEVLFDSMTVSQQGTYSLIIAGQGMCADTVNFEVTVNYAVLDVYQAEDYFLQSGTVPEECSDFGGGRYLKDMNNGDWCYYALDLDSAGYYFLTARIESAAPGGEIQVLAGDTLAGEIRILPAPDGKWQKWFTTGPVEIFLEQGLQLLKFVFAGGESSQIHFNWFDLFYERPTGLPLHTTGPLRLEVFPVPAVGETYITYTLQESTNVRLDVMDPSGRLVACLEDTGHKKPGKYTIRWNPKGPGSNRLWQGACFVVLRTGDRIEIKKILIL